MLWNYIRKAFKRKERRYYLNWVHSFNDTVIVYPTEKGWEKIYETYADQYIEDRKTDADGYKDTFWCMIEDMGEMFCHGSNYLHSRFEIVERIG